MRYEVRRCDYCDHRSSQHAMTPEWLERRGWTVDDEGRDKCPTCAFCEDTEPLTSALAGSDRP